MTGDLPKEWEPGSVVIHRTGSARVLNCRKDDDSGWWLLGHGGLDDRAAVTDEWVHMSTAFMRSVFSNATVSR